MHKNDLKKMTLMGITGAILLLSPGGSNAEVYNAGEMLAARSWTCRKGTCGMPRHSQPHGQKNYQNQNGQYNGRPNGNGAPEGNIPEGNGNGAPGSNGPEGSESSFRTARYRAGNHISMGYEDLPVPAEEVEEVQKEYQDRTAPVEEEEGEYPYQYRQREDSKRMMDNRYRGGHSGCGGSSNYDVTSERDLVAQLNSEGRELYYKLDKEDQELALRLAKQYSDKNQAVKQAARIGGRQNEPVRGPSSHLKRFTMVQ